MLIRVPEKARPGGAAGGGRRPLPANAAWSTEGIAMPKAPPGTRLAHGQPMVVGQKCVIKGSISTPLLNGQVCEYKSISAREGKVIVRLVHDTSETGREDRRLSFDNLVPLVHDGSGDNDGEPFRGEVPALYERITQRLQELRELRAMEGNARRADPIDVMSRRVRPVGVAGSESVACPESGAGAASSSAGIIREVEAGDSRATDAQSEGRAPEMGDPNDPG